VANVAPLRGRIWIGVIGWEPLDVHLGYAPRGVEMPLKIGQVYIFPEMVS